jgi:hypothetical protein
VRFGSHRIRIITILDSGRVSLHDQQIAFGVRGAVPLASIGLFAAIKSSLAARFGGRSAGTRRFGGRYCWRSELDGGPVVRAPSGASGRGSP